MSQKAIDQWSGTEDLQKGQTILLEASAGTENLPNRRTRDPLSRGVRVPIDRILVITFTNAATAELRIVCVCASRRRVMSSSRAPSQPMITFWRSLERPIAP